MPSDPDNEWLDVVDIDDRVIGRATRREIHDRGLRHRSVHVLMYDGAGRLFVQKRSLSKDTNPGLWDTSAAGHVDSGERCLAAAVRELAEELGVNVGESSLVPLFVLQPDCATGNEFVSVYRVVSDRAVTLEAGEIEDGDWLDTETLHRCLSGTPERFTGVFRTIVERAALLTDTNRLS